MLVSGCYESIVVLCVLAAEARSAVLTSQPLLVNSG